MTNDRTANIVGALALAVVDTLLREAQAAAPEPGPAAAAISLLAHDPGMSIDRLRRALGLSHPGAVRLVDRLVADGAVVREVSDRDRRAVALHLTEAGRRTCANIRGARLHSLTKVLDLLDADERATLGMLTEKLLRGLVGTEDQAYSVCRLCDESVCADCPAASALGPPNAIG
ncbi:MarR family transcriptional regulator (plasmid) [Skermanella sp. TT6]|uniref:MarR family transcriptional regulator n=1 Tax=Skermanella cutis TaxID=2775420 RepID=A0ABX7BLE2_9PROT|nr:MarR family transcriptional regulator [Skermanella sp. TT6]QQP93827.1 MarR family transcriptional regulator [Skermanella sp. TT6]